MTYKNQPIGITERGDAALDLSWTDWVFNKKKPAILITKDPTKLISNSYPEDLTKQNIIIHCTITGWGGTTLEPFVPRPEISLNTFKTLVDQMGSDRVVLRIDPIILTDEGEDRALYVFDTFPQTKRVRISFLDNYYHVKTRFKAKGLKPVPYDFHAPLEDRLNFWKALGKPEVCGEPGMVCTGCVSKLDLEVFGISTNNQLAGQRSTCTCLANKTELLKNRKPCKNKCIYCYWKD